MPPFSATVVKHGTFHPNDQFSNFRGRCVLMLLATAREAFATMESFGIVRHSNSQWIHLGLFHSSRRHVDFLKVDQVLGYHQVPMCAENMPKTAVITPVHIF